MPGLLRALHCAPVQEFLTVEFPERPKMVADVVARLADSKILHLEFQLSNDPRMHWRCYHYFGAIQEQWEDSEVIQVVVYLGNGPMTMKREIERPSLRYHYTALDVREIPAQVFLDSPHNAERVLALLCQSQDPRHTVRRVLESWRHLTDKVLLENIERLKTVSNLRGIEIIADEELHRMPLMPFEVDMTTSLWYKEGEAGLLCRMLESLFGPLPEATRKRIYDASQDQIEDWAIRTHRAGSLADVFED